MTEIPLVDLRAQYAAIKDEIDSAIERVINSQYFIGGPETAAFEEEYASAHGVEFAVGCSNGTTALTIALQSMGVAPGDEVITSTHTFFATAEAIVEVGAVPVLVDIDPDTLNIDPEQISAAITPRTVGIVPVHLYGNPAAMNEIMDVADQQGLWVLEDAAQAHMATYEGSKAGSIGNCGSFSFYPGKNLGAYGDAGALTTSDAALAERMRKLRDHGRAGKYEHDVYGSNHRIDELQAAVLRVKLSHLEDWTQARRDAARRYDQLLGELDIQTLRPTPGGEPVWHLYPVLLDRRDHVFEHMRGAGIGVGIHYPIPVHLQPAHLSRFGRVSLPVAEAACSRVLSLPLYPEISPEAQERVVATLQEATTSP